MLQKGFGTGICCEKRCWSETAEGAHGENEAAFVGEHVRKNGLGYSKGSSAVDVDYVGHFVQRCLSEGDRYAVRLADIVDKDGNSFVLQKVGEGFIIGVGSFREVDSEGLRVGARRGGLDLRG